MDVDTALKIVLEGLENGDVTVISILVAVAVVLLTIFILACSGGSNKRRGVILLGMCDAGKTLLFHQLVYKKFVETCTSMKVNSGSYEVPNNGKKLQVTDIPGHERLRGKILDEQKSLTRGIIYVVDSVGIQKELKDVAEFMYNALTDRVISGNYPPILIACNKQDRMRSKGSKVVRDMLEKEMNTVRQTKSAALLTTDETGNNNSFLGKQGQSFSFSDIKPFKIDFVECSALGSEGICDINEVESWLEKIA